MSQVTHYSDVPRRVITANRIATSAAPIIVMPLRMPPGRSMVGTTPMRSVDSPGALAVTVKPYGLRNSADARTSFSSCMDAPMGLDQRIRLHNAIGATVA